MKHQLIFQAAWLTTVFAAYMLLNCIAVAGLVYGEYLHFTGRLF